MKLYDLFSMCWRLVLRNRRRYKAVLAGIAVGTAGFIVIQTMGQSVEKKMGEHLDILGEATVMKAYWDLEENYHPGQFYKRDVARLKQIPHMMAVAPVVSLPAVDAQFHTTEWSPGLFGVDHSYWLTQTPHVLKGRLIGPSDVVGRKYVCVLGKDVVGYLFGGKDPVGQVIRVGNLSFTVIGTLGGVQHTDIKRSIFIPITTAQNLFQGLYWIREIYMRVDNWDRVDWAREQVLKTLRASHTGYEDGIRVMHYPKRIQKVQATAYLVKLFIVAALAVTIILGGLGISNVMLAAIQDRTREIGLRKALGAREEVIMLQFLTESTLISFVAGAVGVLAGVLTVEILKNQLEVHVSAASLLMSVVIGLLFTAILGIVSGLYPSIKASRMDSVTAMRFE
ncbi:MAG: ABC transporter permease [Desulfomonile tiedjei]|nr:ABC transporter permease [Desulfomonile tiedjei]